MAIIRTTNQYKVASAGPVDTKALVKTYKELTSRETWQATTDKGAVVNTAYNGMLTAVWLNTADTSKNGIYFLHDPEVTSIFGAPDVTKEANWHKLGGLNDLPGLTDQIASIQESLEDLQDDVDDLQETATVVVNQKKELPLEGVSGKIYVVTEEAATYVWYNGNYLPVGDGAPEIQIISGGNATT